MAISELANVFQASICIALFAIVLFKFWADARLDAFRQEMFIIRDELFDYAVSGKIGLDNPSYRLLRQMMNGLIRYGHQITFFRLCLTVIEIKLAGRGSEPQWSTNWEKELLNIRDESVRRQMEDFHERAILQTAKRLALGSPVLILALAILFPVVALHLAWQRSLHNVKKIFTKAPSDIFSYVVRQISAVAPKVTFPYIVATRIIENEAAALATA